MLMPQDVKSVLSPERFAVVNLCGFMTVTDRRLHARVMLDTAKHRQRQQWGADVSDPFDVPPAWPWVIILAHHGPEGGDLMQMAATWGKFLLDCQRWDHPGSEDLANHALWPTGRGSPAQLSPETAARCTCSVTPPLYLSMQALTTRAASPCSRSTSTCPPTLIPLRLRRRVGRSPRPGLQPRGSRHLTRPTTD
jgi:hypothetical protein